MSIDEMDDFVFENQEVITRVGEKVVKMMKSFPLFSM